MSNILLEIESMLEAAVSAGLSEAASDMEIQLQRDTAKRIKSDKRNLTASDNEKPVDEAEAEDDEDKEGKSSSGESGGDMSKRPVITPDKLPSTITVDMVINGIDAIRSARSLKKPDVRAEFEEYFNSLSGDEKIGLLAIVYGIAETLIGDSPGRGLDPSEEPYNVKMQSDPEQTDLEPTTTVAVDDPNDPDDTPIVVGG